MKLMIQMATDGIQGNVQLGRAVEECASHKLYTSSTRMEVEADKIIMTVISLQNIHRSWF